MPLRVAAGGRRAVNEETGGSSGHVSTSLTGRPIVVARPSFFFLSLHIDYLFKTHTGGTYTGHLFVQSSWENGEPNTTTTTTGA